jgi:hypothetical protein
MFWKLFPALPDRDRRYHSITKVEELKVPYQPPLWGGASRRPSQVSKIDSAGSSLQ